MIIWINGPFGAGKTQTAYELHRRLPHSFVFDPENAGYYIRQNMPAQAALGDFQDYPMWREFNYAMLMHISAAYDGIVIVPMTVVDPAYFEQLVGRLRGDGVEVHHVALCPSRSTVLRRLRKRGEGAGSWAARQLDRCLEGLSDERFRHQLQTDDMTVPETAERIAAMLQLPLQPDRRGPLRKLRDRLVTQLRHIRFFQ